ncbi:MAG: hypothetical protein C4523_02015 [Myxococcales bacterium]|nr:MAG: hypothetical protein C4523_02015 [Myxococcales bacterium]
MEDLWQAFKDRYSGQGLPIDAFWEDGIFNEDAYRQARPKILFVLKEVNSQEQKDLRKFLKGGPRYPIWHAVARWAAGLTYGFPAYSEIGEKARAAFCGVAAVNLKKTGGSGSANMAEIAAYAYIARDLIVRQIEEIRPDVIVACGVFDILKWLFEFPINPTDPDRPVRETQGRFWVVPFRHPGRANMYGERYYSELKERVERVPELVSLLYGQQAKADADGQRLNFFNDLETPPEEELSKVPTQRDLFSGLAELKEEKAEEETKKEED